MKASMNGKFGGAVGRLAISLLAVMAAATAPAQSVTIDFVTVGYANNPSDPLTGRGSVGYDYRIGKFEVTNEQYATFLNAVAKSDPFDLYNPAMGTGTHVGITRVGVSGNFSYSVMPGFESKPIMYVSYWDAARFVNWLGTGSAEGRTTQGGPLLAGAAYDLNFKGMPTPEQGSRLAGAAFGLPTQDEWYKAAYYQPKAVGGPSDSYWWYPTGSDSPPTASTPTALLNRANFSNAVGTVTDVGAYAGSPSFFGTYDQGGNVWEWNTIRAGSSSPTVRGGAWDGFVDYQRSEWVSDYGAGSETVFGFRVASLAPIPEPSTYAALAGLASLGVALLRRRTRRGGPSA